MIQTANVVGNPTTILIERIFWLALGGLLVVTLITSYTRGLREK